MKKIILALSVIALMASCKKESVAPAPTPTSPCGPGYVYIIQSGQCMPDGSIPPGTYTPPF
jgi:hypothetical protein